ncbi:HesA/MoeB/ThiF family protein [Mycoplasmatota bacterium zrk1]
MRKRYIKNMNMLTEEEISKVNSGRVCVIGCGGLGGFVIEGLVRLGFENMTIVDNDVFDQTNLNRQLLANESNISASKSLIASERIKKINSNCTVNPITLKFDQKFGRKIIANHDIVIDAVDNAKTKLLIEEYCKELKIPMVHGAIGGWFGQVANIMPGDDLLKKIYAHEQEGIETELGNPSFTPAVIANIMVSEALKIYLDKDILSNQLLTVDLLNNEFEKIDF